MKRVLTDNRALDAKVELRRHFVDRYHPVGTPIRIFDCCQGSGTVWNAVLPLFPEREFRYWGVDVKPKAGRLKIDSARVLQQPGWKEDIVDIDTYGAPWKHWFGMLPNLAQDITVFLTIGSVGVRTEKMDKLALQNMGLVFDRKLPAGFEGKMTRMSVDYCLAAVSRFNCRIVDLTEAFPQDNCRYLAMRLELNR